MPGWLKVAAVAIAFLAAMGVLYGISSGIFVDWATEPTDSGWPWWYYVLALPVVGLLGLVAEAIGEAIGHVFVKPVFDAWDALPRWLRSALVVILPLAVIAGSLWLGTRGGGGYDPAAPSPR